MISHFELKAFQKVQVGKCYVLLSMKLIQDISENNLWFGTTYCSKNQISFGPFAEYREYFAVKQHFLSQELSLEIIYCHKNLSVHLINTA